MLAVAIVIAGCTTADPAAVTELANPVSISLTNPGFEETDGWNGLVQETSEYWAPVEGLGYAKVESDADPLIQHTGQPIEAGQSYLLTLWTRSLNQPGLAKPTPLEVSLLADGEPVATVTSDVSAPRLVGDPRRIPNDDGANVWIDQGYRMQFSDTVVYQMQDDDPILDPWDAINDPDYDVDMAVGPIITPQGLRGVYSTFYRERSPVYSEIRIVVAAGSPPDYAWRQGDAVLSHSGDEEPWTIDAHLTYDDATERLWMAWGGGTIYVSELDPATGFLFGNLPDTEFDTHPEGTHTPVARWNGDEWTGGNSWFEGPALYKRGDYWYLFASYGDLAINYSIRMGRGASPTGPFYDKDGVSLVEWDRDEEEYGNTFLLAGEGGQDSPGHPHVWEEDGRTFMGFDYVDDYDGSRTDRMGIRELRWVDGWPTVWKPLTVHLSERQARALAGKELGISITSVGEPLTTAGIDRVRLVTGTAE